MNYELLLYRPLLAHCRFFSFWTLRTVSRTRRKISQYQDLYLHTEHKHKIVAHNTDIHALSGIRTKDRSVRASEDTLCLRPCGHCDRRRPPNYLSKLHSPQLIRRKIQRPSLQGFTRLVI
jgi:hypothetical protein